MSIYEGYGTFKTSEIIKDFFFLFFFRSPTEKKKKKKKSGHIKGAAKLELKLAPAHCKTKVEKKYIS